MACVRGRFARGVLKINVAAVGRNGRPVGVLLVFAADNFQSFAAVAVVEPDSGRRARFQSGCYGVPRHKNISAVGGPYRFVHTEIFVFDNGVRIRAVGVHDPEIVLAAAICDEGDVFSVGRKAGVGVECYAALLREAFGVAACYRHAVDVREKVEDDPFAVGRNVNGHPGAFGSVEGDVARRATCERGVPLFFGLVFWFLIVVAARESGKRKRCEGEEE